MMTITYIIIFVYSKRVTHRQFETGCPQSGDGGREIVLGKNMEGDPWLLVLVSS